MRAYLVSPRGAGDAGGVERVMRYARESLELRGFRVSILDRAALDRSVWGRMLLPLRRGCFGYVGDALGYSLLAWSRSRARAANETGRALLVTNGGGCPFVRADIVFAHGSMRGFLLALDDSRWRWGLEELMEAAAGLLARRVAAVSRRAGTEWRRWYAVPAKKIRILRNCVDTEHFSPRRDTRSDAAKTRILFVGRLGPQKAPERLLALCDATARSGASCELVIAAPSAEGTDAFAARSGVEIRTGLRYPDMPDLYRACDVMYLPSRYEGFEMVTTEALACGIPVVGSRVGAIAELSADGFPGIFAVDALDPDAALATILRAAAEWGVPDRARDLAAATERRFSLAAWSRRFLDIAAELTGIAEPEEEIAAPSARQAAPSARMTAPAPAPTVSVIVPTYNRARLLPRVLPTYLQPETGELIVVDDCSTDDTQAVLRDMAAREPRIRVLRSERNLRQTHAKNMGIAAARFDLLYFGDDDALLMPGSLAALLATRERRGADIVGSRAPYMETDAADPTAFLAAQPALRGPLVNTLSLATRFHLDPGAPLKAPFVHAAFLVSRDIARRIRFDEAYIGNCFREETDFLVRARADGASIWFEPAAIQINLPRAAAAGGAHGGGAHGGGGPGSGAFVRRKLRYFREALANNRRFLKKNAVALDMALGVHYPAILRQTILALDIAGVILSWPVKKVLCRGR